MPPTIAIFTWLILLLALLRYESAKEPATSVALWVPLAWFFITGSRLPSQWLAGQVGYAAQALEEGNALDRVVYSLLILLAIGVLMSRSFSWRGFFVGNFALTAFLFFGLMSVLWSDFPFIAFKRWFRDLGNYLAILVVLSDSRPLHAARTLLRRLCYLLVPLSILLIKYYPELGRSYDIWTGRPYYVGVTTSKNMLGVLCLISGLIFFWDTLTRWSNRAERRTRQIILVNIAFIAMTLWLLDLSSSATSQVCLILGCVVIAAAHNKTVKRYPAVLKVLIPVGICLYILLEFAFGIDITAAVAQAVGRNPTLTGRTDIWEIVINANTNPLIGTGYESFWLGHRLRWVWEQSGKINEAHNGYLETYLTLGLVGLFLLVAFLIVSYRTICRRFTTSPSLVSLNLALWTTLLFYNVTESAFKGHLIWNAFLLGVLVVPTLGDRSPTKGALIDEHPFTLHESVTV